MRQHLHKAAGQGKINIRTHKTPSKQSKDKLKSQGITDWLLRLQQNHGNKAVQHLLNNSMIQAKLQISSPSDEYEQEADRIATQIMSTDSDVWSSNKKQVSIQRVAANQTAVNSSTPSEVMQQVVDSPGQPLDKKTRTFMETRFGYDFSRVRVHTDAKATQSAQAIGASAYTMGHDVVFNAGQYAPTTSEGRRLLAHELAHTVQQQLVTTPTIQRDLKAYHKAKTEMLPSMDTMGMSSSYVKISAEAPGIRNALSALIAAGKIKEVTSSDGSVSWFAAEHHKNAQLDEIRQALDSAGYAKADKLARAIYDIHAEFLYSNQDLVTIAPFYSGSTKLGEKIEYQKARSLTEWEIGQAQRVFGNALKYSSVTIAEGSIPADVASVGGYVRTIGNTINFPEGSSRNMPLIIHELTHVWQYQTTGWTYAPRALWAQMTEGYDYTEAGKTAEQSLKDARIAGKTLYSYNKEQQGDILRDYYSRLQQGQDTSAWEPFVKDIPGR